MSAIKIYHNNRCSKSNQALNYLKEKNALEDIDVIYYLDNPMSTEEANYIIDHLQGDLEELVRKPDAKKLEVEVPKELTKDWLVKMMTQTPKIMQRPIIVANGKAVIARPTERIDLVV